MSGQMLMICGTALLVGASAVFVVLELVFRKKKRNLEDQVYQIF